VYRNERIISAIPGVISTYPNSHVTSIKASPWPQVLALMGKEGERMMIDLILDCGVFLPVRSGRGSYYQLSGLSTFVGSPVVLLICLTGQPLGELKPLPKTNGVTNLPVTTENSKFAIDATKSEIRTPASIVFVRNRMLYARAALNAQGGVRFGLRHIRRSFCG